MTFTDDKGEVHLIRNKRFDATRHTHTAWCGTVAPTERVMTGPDSAATCLRCKGGKAKLRPPAVQGGSS